MGVSKNKGTPKSSIFSVNYKPSILGYHYFWKHPHPLYNGCLVKHPFPISKGLVHHPIIQLKQPFKTGCLEFQEQILHKDIEQFFGAVMSKLKLEFFECKLYNNDISSMRFLYLHLSVNMWLLHQEPKNAAH